MANNNDEEFDVEEARESLLEEIVGCYNCQPWDSGEVIWLGPKSDLEDLLIYCDVEDEHWEEVLEELNCPNCGTSLTEIGDEVEVKTEYDKNVEKVMRQATSPELIEKLHGFNDFLKEFPYLGLCDPENIGNEILNKIYNWDRYQLPVKVWYRARKLNEESRIFKSTEMGAPDPKDTYIWEGRYNHTGQSFLYLADDPETAFKEIKQGDMNICAIQKFKASDNITVLDLRQDYRNINPEVELLALSVIYNGVISQKPDEHNSWKPEYFVSRFVADCARKNDYDGILFSSVSRYVGEDLVVFPSKVSIFTIEGECSSFYQEEETSKSTFNSGTGSFHINLLNEPFDKG